MVKSLPAKVGIGNIRDMGSIPRWRRAWQPTQAFLPGESHRQRSQVGYSPEGCTQLDTTKVTWHVLYSQVAHLHTRLKCAKEM